MRNYLHGPVNPWPIFLMHLSIFRAGYKCFQIELSMTYGQTEWRKDVKDILLSAGLQDQKITFLFDETQVYSRTILPSAAVFS